MAVWRDAFTGMQYDLPSEWLVCVRKYLSGRLAKQLEGARDVRAAADCAARFWQAYYGFVFPLRFGSSDEHSPLSVADISENTPLYDPYNERRVRVSADGVSHPPILPDGPCDGGVQEGLASDFALCRAAMANVLLRSEGADDEDIHCARLGCLLAPLCSELEANRDLSDRYAKAFAVAHYISGGSDDPPFASDVLRSVKHAEYGDREVGLVVAQVQRVQKYVLETPGLNEIRGGSTLLERITEELANGPVAQEIGPEVVLRAAGSALLFVAPISSMGDWPPRLTREFIQKTGSAFATAACAKVKAQELWGSGYRSAIGTVYQALEKERAAGRQPLQETLPFEQRCTVCRQRPAEQWFHAPDGQVRAICIPCLRKRREGRSEKYGKSQKLIERVLGTDGWRDLGISGDSLESILPDDLGSLVPETARRKLVATICGDGNNFGAVYLKLNSLWSSLQWTHRVKHVTEGAAALALVGATRRLAQRLGARGGAPVLSKLPFQVLALGGDDMSLFAAGPVALDFAASFLRLIDTEFERGTGKALIDRRISFSMGVLLCDKNAPVQRTVQFAEDNLLKWAKQATIKRLGADSNTPSNVSVLFANTPEQIPSDIEAYRSRMYLRGSGHATLCLTLRPYTAEELRWLLETASTVLDHGYSGRLQRLVSPFVLDTPMAAVLHYAYQKARESGGLSALLDNLQGLPPGLQNLRFPASSSNELGGRLAFGVKEDGPPPWFSALWDLFELVKVLQLGG